MKLNFLIGPGEGQLTHRLSIVDADIDPFARSRRIHHLRLDADPPDLSKHFAGILARGDLEEGERLIIALDLHTDLTIRQERRRKLQELRFRLKRRSRQPKDRAEHQEDAK